MPPCIIINKCEMSASKISEEKVWRRMLLLYSTLHKHRFWPAPLSYTCVLIYHFDLHFDDALDEISSCGRVLWWNLRRNSKTVWGNKWCRKATFWRSFASIAFLIYFDFKTMINEHFIGKIDKLFQKSIDVTSYAHSLRFIFRVFQITFWACLLFIFCQVSFY